MARAYTTTFRSYADIKQAAENARELSSLRDTIDFSLTDYIRGPLKDYFRGRLNISIVSDDFMAQPAKVDLRKKDSSIELAVKKKTWFDSIEKCADARFILSHEIGHIWLHRDDEFGFSDAIEQNSRFIESEYFVEDQANVFADLFLLTDGAVKRFDTAESLFDYCEYYFGIPRSAIDRRFAAVGRSISHYFGPRYESNRICQKCGGNKVVAVLNFRKCDECKNIRY